MASWPVDVPQTGELTSGDRRDDRAPAVAAGEPLANITNRAISEEENRKRLRSENPATVTNAEVQESRRRRVALETCEAQMMNGMGNGAILAAIAANGAAIAANGAAIAEELHRFPSHSSFALHTFPMPLVGDDFLGLLRQLWWRDSPSGDVYGFPPPKSRGWLCWRVALLQRWQEHDHHEGNTSLCNQVHLPRMSMRPFAQHRRANLPS